MPRASIERLDYLLSRAWIGGPACSELDCRPVREGTSSRCCVACVLCSHLVPPFLIHCFSKLLGMLLAATDMTDLLLIVELLPVITDLVIVYFLIVMVCLIVVWVDI